MTADLVLYLRARDVLAVALLLAGCASPILWTKDGPIGPEAQRDEYECMQDARASNPRAVWPAADNTQLTLPARAVYIRCMESKGYRRVEQ